MKPEHTYAQTEITEMITAIVSYKLSYNSDHFSINLSKLINLNLIINYIIPVTVAEWSSG